MEVDLSLDYVTSSFDNLYDSTFDDINSVLMFNKNSTPIHNSRVTDEVNNHRFKYKADPLPPQNVSNIFYFTKQ